MQNMTHSPSIHVLPNGLTTITVSMPNVKSVTVLALVKAGTRYETPKTNGISHFIEHAVSKGTKAFPQAMDIALAIDNIGGKNNAYTSKEQTAYFVKSAVEHIEVGLKVVSDLVFHPTFPKDDVDIERGVILEEIRMYEDEPQAKVARLFEEVMFAPTTLGWQTLGTPENIRSISTDDFREYMEYMYTPERMVLVVAGGVTNKHNGLIENYFGVERPKVSFTEERFSFDQTAPQLKSIAKDTEQTHLVYGYRTFGRGNKDRYVLSVLTTLLGGGMSSRLFTEIREKRGLAYYVGAYPNLYAESGYLAMTAGTKPNSAQEVIKLSEAEFQSLATQPVSAQELNKAKAYLKGHLVLNWEDSMSIAEFYGDDQLLMGKMRTQEEVLRGIEAVDAKAVQRLAKHIFTKAGRNAAVIGPENKIQNISI
jgi:predicted Zn-dependent peptidase